MLELGQAKTKCRQAETSAEKARLTVSVLRPFNLSTFSLKFLSQIM